MGVLARSGAETRAGLTSGIHPYNENLQRSGGVIPFDIATPQGLAMIEAEITRQSWMVGYLNDFRLLVVLGICMIPLVFFLRAPSHVGAGKGGP